MFTRKDIIESARSYVGVKFRMHGRDRTGLDCVGLLFCIGKDVGIEAINDTDYGGTPVPNKFGEMLERYTHLVSPSPPRSGQVLKLRQLMWPMHIGILAVDKNRMTVINANMKKKKVTEDTFNEWQNLVMEHRDINGVRGI